MAADRPAGRLPHTYTLQAVKQYVDIPSHSTFELPLYGTLLTMDVSPFPYQGPLEPEQVRGRRELIADLTERVTEHRVTALLGPRRYGKTSVLRRVASDVIHSGVAIVWVDFYEVVSMADIAARLDDALARVPGRFRQLASKLAAAAEINLGVVKFELRSASDGRPDPMMVTHGLLDVLTKSADEHPTVVIFDEFAGIARIEGAAGLLRTKLQHHYQRLGIVFAGSEVSMMRMLFAEQAQPFYSQADLVEIGPLSNAEVVDARVRGLRRHRTATPDRCPRSSAGSPAAIPSARCRWPTRPGGSSLLAKPQPSRRGRMRSTTSGQRPATATNGCTPACSPARRRCCAPSPAGGRSSVPPPRCSTSRRAPPSTPARRSPTAAT